MSSNKKFLNYLLLISLGLTILSIIPTSKATNPPTLPWTQWTITYGGTGFEWEKSMIQTNDNGFAMAGSTTSFGAGKTDFWLVKTDAYGNPLWGKTYGGSNDDMPFSMIQTNDGGYALVGTTVLSANNINCWLVKTDAYGNQEWNKTYGGPSNQRANFIIKANSIIQTRDNGYAIAGSNLSAINNEDFLLIKTDSYGNQIWNKTYVGKGNEVAHSIIQTNDNGYAMVGVTDLIPHGDPDFYLVKTDAFGNQEWNRTYAYNNVEWNETYSVFSVDFAYSIIQTNDNGYAIVGYTSARAKSDDFWLVKTDSYGNEQWNQTYGGIDLERANSIIQTNDGGYAIAGTSISYGSGGNDFWVVKTDALGNAEWNKTYGGIENENAYSVVQTSDGAYALAGVTNSFGAGAFDFWLVKTAPTLTTLNSEGGQLYPSVGTFSVPEIEGAAWLIAHPDDGYMFSHFLIDGKITPAQYIEDDGDYTYYLNMDTSHTVQAIFTVGLPIFPTLTILDSIGGQIYPPPRMYIYPDISDTGWITAHPNSGYKFNYFLIDGIITPNQYFEEDGDYTYYLALDTSHSVQAIFTPS